MIDAVLLELEGVLADTAVPRCRALQASLAAEGLELSAEEFDLRCAGLPVLAAARAAIQLRGVLLDETALDLIVLRAERSFATIASHGLPLMPGARDFIENAAACTRVALVTRGGRRHAESLLSLAGIADAFECVIGAEDTIEPKPSSAPYRHALARMGRRRALRTGESFAMEDGAPGIRAARAAGIPCVAVGMLDAQAALEADAYLPSLRGQSVRGIGALVAPRADQAS
ncbi:MAG: HAD family phosphatase [Gemmatimonadota bacterium]|nr:HAD family phosphatase [Gemmatimonadota bacterium]